MAKSYEATGLDRIVAAPAARRAMAAKKQIYTMTLSLNVLNHLGLNLYSNAPAVLAEIVANSWDADATTVTIDLDDGGERILIKDDGHGMNLDDINAKFLYVGYDRRSKPGEAVTPRFGRKVTGRKGIGKLSLFSIAENVEVHSVKAGRKNGFVMSVKDIRKTIKRGTGTYHPKPVDKRTIKIDTGTLIVLSDLKKKFTGSQTETALRKRLARRFSIIGSEYNFAVIVNGSPITVVDRDYFHKIQYLWWYGSESQKYVDACDHLEHNEERSGALPGTTYQVNGWIGTVKAAGDLRTADDKLNKISILVRGKLAQEDLLEDFGEGGMYTKYLIGEIHAEFLDVDDQADIATSSRQKIIEDDPRYRALKDFVHGELKHIEASWTGLRNSAGASKALEIPAIQTWFKGLQQDERRHAEALFGKINQLTLESEADRRRLFKHSVLAFESLRYKRSLDALERISPENLAALGEIFGNLNDIEATLYHQIVKERIEVIKTLQEKVEEAALEKVVQEHLFKHLWLLDPSWERATHNSYMEQQVAKEFGDIDAGLTPEEKAGRLDLKYLLTSGKHVIVELKRADRVVATEELLVQIGKYRSAVQKLLDAAGRGREPVEFVCLVGRPLRDWVDEKTREESRRLLAIRDARVLRYQELIGNAYRAYEEYLEKDAAAGRVYALIRTLDEDEPSIPGV
jgi:hypothetical protein